MKKKSVSIVLTLYIQVNLWKSPLDMPTCMFLANWRVCSKHILAIHPTVEICLDKFHKPASYKGKSQSNIPSLNLINRQVWCVHTFSKTQIHERKLKYCRRHQLLTDYRTPYQTIILWPGMMGHIRIVKSLLGIPSGPNVLWLNQNPMFLTAVICTLKNVIGKPCNSFLVQIKTHNIQT